MHISQVSFGNFLALGDLIRKQDEEKRAKEAAEKKAYDIWYATLTDRQKADLEWDL